ncbi:hypothetical protein NDI56_08670 [Haloarcula sp. S1CR25-12]|uniref:DUF5666 domain-containing protein n=1 Tax=Haloarcula saliterrae TaxID=2950534 RepID=A0ABU2FB47_9EURY|nr:BGTF surface domain-containing protein [Haloarcula sp. S1CR25-12]MDS0259464.1 hypothetical protein [Haloarcula sp. S1CR25-12]
MNRQVGVLVAIGAAIGIAAVTGAVVFDTGETQPQANTTQQVNGTVVLPDTETVRLDATTGQVISGRTDIAAGETLSVRIVSASDAATPFLRSREATVSENGTFRTTVDLSRITDQPDFELTVRHDGDVVASRSGQVVGNATDPITDIDPGANDEYERVGDSNESTTADASFVVEGDVLTLAPSETATLKAETELEAGTRVELRLRSADTSTPFLRSRETTVNEDGTLSAAFNTSDLGPSTAFDATIRYNGSVLTRQSGVVEM